MRQLFRLGIGPPFNHRPTSRVLIITSQQRRFLYMWSQSMKSRDRTISMRNFSIEALHIRSYGSFSNYHYLDYWDSLQSRILEVKYKTLYPGCIYATTHFIDPHPLVNEYEILTLAFIQLLEQYVYHIESNYIKFTIGYIMQLPASYDISLTLDKSIPLYDTLGNPVPKKMIYDLIERNVKLYGEKYESAVIKGVFLRIYYEAKDSTKIFDFPKISDMISQILNVMDSDQVDGELPDVKSLQFKTTRISRKISTIHSEMKECRPFIVADIETILVNNVHVPYAAGYLVVHPGDNLPSIPSYSIKTFFSENHITFYPTFEDRSQRMFFEFLSKLEVDLTNDSRIRTVYFHNFARFDGIIILKYYAERSNIYKIKTLLRNHKLYELKVYRGDKLLLRFRDSYTLLPNPLNTLAKTLCPELGSKGSIPHEDLNMSNIQDHSANLITYLRQDILLLGGVMLKAQEIYWSKYHIDIEDVMTISSLSLKIFRMKYLDDESFPILIPSKNQDAFIRRGYYGGHSDVFKPYGENLYYYDINSLYPFIMKEFPMPCGTPVWKNHLENVELDSLFGFIEAYVVCPSTIANPFLPYRAKNNTLVFPTGKFIGVFYSEELKFARDLGYDIIPLRGYLFEKKSSPFEVFISNLYESRQEAKKAGDEAMSFIYKLLMNSLYGRFGMNLESLVTEICNQEKYEELVKMDHFQSAEKLTDHYYIVNYTVNSTADDDTDWKAPKMSAVQLSAAITACARIYMYPFISRPDCYYTDTDSIILGSPLSDDFISSLELGKFKLECQVLKGIFLAPKSYLLEIEDDRSIIKHKGPAKDIVTSDWFKNQLANLTHTETVTTSANFRIDWNTLRIVKKDLHLRLGIPQSFKRVNVYDSLNVWIDTRPVDVIDLGSQDATTILKYELWKKNDKEVSQSTTEENNTEENKTITEDPNPSLKSRQQYNNMPNKAPNLIKDQQPKPDE